ncbi:TolB protein [Candidatus Kinetoplastibacterium crithidii TCC036E]|uniref:TolB protein n=2 Tax=Candidatus Kinetoplastidibacterium crithidiae TaxID=33056 RepID=M1L5F2_9PROT|nr:TolB protein [Candidatus Kinetoplastibacterium crithidii TCC036E]
MLFFLAIFSYFTQATAQPNIDKNQSIAKEFNIKIYECDNNTYEGQKVIETIQNNLLSIHKFKITKVSEKDKRKNIYNKFLRKNNFDYMVSIQVKHLQDDLYEINFTIENSDDLLDKVSFSGSIKDITRISHIISDRIYETSTGNKGIFNSRLAYVVKKNNIFELQIADHDGKNHQIALRSLKPITSIRWSPDGSKILYVSFETGRAITYMHDLFTSNRVIIADQKGSNSSPSWSPDGEKIALTMTETGLSQIYILDVSTNSFRRLIKSSACDTEACFSSDGKNIIFASDRSGSYQIYSTDLYGQNITRLTFDGDYNGSPVALPNKNMIIYVKKVNDAFNIYALDLSSKKEELITSGRNDQSPSISPNGEYLTYSYINKQGINSIAQISLFNSQIKIIQDKSNYEIFDPSWGPIIK